MASNMTDQNNGQFKQNEAGVEHDASHAAVKSPGSTASGAGDSWDRPTGEGRSASEGRSAGDGRSAGEGRFTGDGRSAGEDRSAGDGRSAGEGRFAGDGRSAGEDRSSGRWNQTIGSTKEAIGGLTGSENLKQAGREQNLRGQRQEAKAQMSDLGNGVADRMTGTFGSAVAGLTGDRQKQMEYQDLRDKGKAKQHGTAQEIQNQAAAQQQATAQ